MSGEIEQPWNDDRLKMNGVFIGCVTKQNADQIMRMQQRPTWSDSRPTKPGHYWISGWRWDLGHPGPFYVFVEFENGRLMGSVPFMDYSSPLNIEEEWGGFKWLGPFDPPELPTT